MAARRTTDDMPTRSPGSMAALLDDFLEHVRVLHYSEGTVQVQERNLLRFFRWCEDRGVVKPQDVGRPALQRYQRYLFHYRQTNGKPLSWSSQHLRLTCLRAFFKWLVRENRLLYNPAADMELPRRVRRLPRAVLSMQEAEEILRQPAIDTPFGLRDRAILETFYSTGMRRMEVVNLDVFDVDLEGGLVHVRQGKGKKDRRVPIGERAASWVDRYLLEVRPHLVVEPDDGVLFLSSTGRRFLGSKMTALVRKYVDAAELGKTGSCHLFRHAMATLMLENGADLRFIQQMLGHAEISTTQIYTQVSIQKLKEIHTLTHPARLRDRSGD